VDGQPSFVERLGFEPDRFQTEAFEGFDQGNHVIVAAPTGAGKTLVASYAVDRALAKGSRVFYTTPIKALSNQKFNDLVAEYGRKNVGLLTGDNVINGDAPVVVMTTEVLRNMLYAGRSLDTLQAVVLDEVHYLQDSYRGPVWEEVIIHLPRHIQLVCLSATVSNADELAAWMETVRGSTTLVVETRRPVELSNRYMVAQKKNAHVELIRTIVGGKANSKGFRFDNDPRQGRGASGRGSKNGGHGPRGRNRQRNDFRTPHRADVIQLLRQRDMLPAIHFIFSRAACTDAARAVVDSGICLTSSEEQAEIRALATEKSAVLSAASLEVLEFDRFLIGLEAGVAAHHAGMVPMMKELVETCFVRGLTKAVFATETLALGINMPARTVVIDKLTKWTGDGHEFLTPAQYTQLTGRAGRRGIDTHGEAIVLWSPWVRFEQVAQLASSREFVLKSAFRPTYNMAANLVRRYEPDRARQLLNLSFAQFRADADVVRTEHRLERLYDRRRQIEGRVEAEFGPIAELRAALATPEASDRDAQDISFALSQLIRGEILELAGPELPSPVVVLSIAYRKGGRVKVRVADAESEAFDLTTPQLDQPPLVIGQIELPEPYLPHSVSFIHEAVQEMNGAQLLSAKRRRKLGPTGAIGSIADLPSGARRGLKRLDKIELEIGEAIKGVRSSADSLARTFDRVIQLLEDRGHLDEWQLTDSGQRLARLYHECDLLIVEALDQGLFDGLNPAELAGLASTVAFEDRRSGPDIEPWYPSGELRRRFSALSRLHDELRSNEQASELPETRQPDPGFIAIAHAWASGGDLDEVLVDEEITAGDFVRTAKLLIDLLRQLAVLASVPATRRAASQAAEAVFRDLVSASSILDVADEKAPDGDLEG
jgi:ATP-dependent RNA helicase HelY